MDLKRLCHISDLPNHIHFLPIELKHLLPIHYPKFIDNATTIITNQAQSLAWPLYPDHSLQLGTSQYDQVNGGWCEDIDGQELHLKSSLQLTTIILNYIQSAISQQIPQKQQRTTPIQKIQHFLGNSRVNSSIEGLAAGVAAIAYNIYRMTGKEGKTRFVFLLGRHATRDLRLFSVANTVREWNIKRLKTDTCQPLTVNRCHKLIEHQLMILRGFMCLGDEDHHLNKQELTDIINSIDPQDQNPSLKRGDLQNDQVLMFSRFDYQYKDKLQPKELMCFCAQILLELTAYMPINVSCSFLGRLVANHKLNRIVVLWLTTYKPPSGHRNVKLTDSPLLAKAVNKAVEFLRKKQLEKIRDPTVNLADEILKSSLRVLSRYQPAEEKKELSNSSSAYPQSRLNESYFEDRHKFDFDRISNISKISFKHPHHDRSAKDLEGSRIVSEGRGNYQSLTSPLVMHRDREYNDILKVVEEWEKSNGKIIPYNELKSELQKNSDNAKLRYGKTNLTEDESSLLLAFAALQYYLDVDEVVMMLKDYAGHRDSIFEIMFQRSNVGSLLEMGIKIAKECAQSLYESYLTKQFRIDRTNLLVCFLKKYLSLFTTGTNLPDLTDKIVVPILLDLLETKQYRTEKYHTFIKPLLTDIFPQTNELKLIAPVLQTLYLALAADHHEELINGLVADLAYESLYYYYDSNHINNSPYRRDIPIKQKKIQEMLREAGFNSLGFELKHTLRPLLATHAQYCLPSTKIYDQVVIARPIHITRFIELLMQAQSTQHLLNLARFFRSLQNAAVGITRTVGNVYLKEQVKRFTFEIGAQETIQLNSRKSQSGIFQQLLAYNPQIKIAGMSLSQVLKNRQSDKRPGQSSEKYNLEYILGRVLTLNLEETYEFIKIVGNLRDRYTHYEQLKEDEKIYLKQIVQQVLARKTAIYQYLHLDRLVKNYGRAAVPYLF